MNDLHDLYIYRYDVFCEKQEIVFYLHDYDKKHFSVMTICGVITHHFNYVFSGNIVSAFVVREDIEQFFDENTNVLTDYNSMGLDISVKQSSSFVEEICKRKKKVFEVRSSYGLSGWIIGEEWNVEKSSSRS